MLALLLDDVVAAGAAAVVSSWSAEDVVLVDPEDTVAFVVPSLSWKTPPYPPEGLTRVVLAGRDVDDAKVDEAWLVLEAADVVLISVLDGEVFGSEVVVGGESVDVSAVVAAACRPRTTTAA